MLKKNTMAAIFLIMSCFVMNAWADQGDSCTKSHPKCTGVCDHGKVKCEFPAQTGPGDLSGLCKCVLDKKPE